MFRKSALAFTLLVFVLTFVIKWLVLNETQSKIVPAKPKPKPETEVVQKLKITAVVEMQAPVVSRKTDKIQKVKEISKSVRKADRPVHIKQLSKKKVIKHKNSVAKRNVKVIEVTKKHAEEGLKLLKGKRPMPLLELDFIDIGVSRYLTMMKGLGARIFIADAGTRNLVGEAVLYIDAAKVSFIGFKGGNLDLGGLAAMPHEIVDEDIVEVILSNARSTFTGEDLRCVVILPVEKEAAFMGAIHEAVGNAGYRMQDFSRFSGEYRTGGRMSLFIDEGVLRSGKRIALGLTLDIFHLAGG